MQSILRLGTRKSLLARAQSSWVAREIEKRHPNVRVELFGIETRGDQIQNIPLSKVEGKEFFVAEIDDALRSRKVDFTVHSYKDLSLERPPEFVTGAVPKRANPRDIVLFGPHALNRLKAGESLKIGTSSPRRLENVPVFLRQALPWTNGRPAADCVFEEIRGNVNTRLSRVQESPQSDRYLDGVVLAFAGLIRLWQFEEGQTELKKLLSGVRWMVLPHAECPAAPAQGALAIECRREDAQTREILGSLNDLATISQIARERAMLAEAGGGCHQQFGAVCADSAELGELLFVRGKSLAGVQLDEIRWNQPEPPLLSTEVKPWDGNRVLKDSLGDEIPFASLPLVGNTVFVAHSRAVSAKLSPELEQSRVWTSGTASWFKLAKRGVWVEGCAEGFGFDSLVSTLEEPVLQLPDLNSWVVVTHESAQEDWIRRGIRVLPTYRCQNEYSIDTQTALSKATHVFWSSGSQYDELRGWHAQSIHHACGPGKTVQKLRSNGLNPVVFPSAKEWRAWLKIER